MKINRIKLIIVIAMLFMLLVIFLPGCGCPSHPDPVFNIGNNFSETVTVYFNGHDVGKIKAGSSNKFYPNEVLTKTSQSLQVDLKTNSGKILFSKIYTWDELTKLLESVHGNPYWITTSSLTEPYDVIVSFPDGASSLNQTATLRCVVKSNYPHLKGMSLKVDLPEALELVSGELSWVGDVPPYGEVNAIEAQVKSVKVGNWTVVVTAPYLPQNGMENFGHHDIYVSISENSAEWRVNPSYDTPTGTTATKPTTGVR